MVDGVDNSCFQVCICFAKNVRLSTCRPTSVTLGNIHSIQSIVLGGSFNEAADCVTISSLKDVSTVLLPFTLAPCWFSPGGDKLCHSQGAEVQSGHTDLPPVERRPAGLWPQLWQQGGRQCLCQCHDARPGGAQLPGLRWGCLFVTVEPLSNVTLVLGKQNIFFILLSTQVLYLFTKCDKPENKLLGYILFSSSLFVNQSYLNRLER